MSARTTASARSTADESQTAARSKPAGISYKTADASQSSTRSTPAIKGYTFRGVPDLFPQQAGASRPQPRTQVDPPSRPGPALLSDSIAETRRGSTTTPPRVEVQERSTASSSSAAPAPAWSPNTVTKTVMALQDRVEVVEGKVEVVEGKVDTLTGQIGELYAEVKKAAEERTTLFGLCDNLQQKLADVDEDAIKFRELYRMDSSMQLLDRDIVKARDIFIRREETTDMYCLLADLDVHDVLRFKLILGKHYADDARTGEKIRIVWDEVHEEIWKTLTDLGDRRVQLTDEERGAIKKICDGIQQITGTILGGKGIPAAQTILETKNRARGAASWWG